MPQAGSSDVLRRNNVRLAGLADARSIMFAHGFGCDQNMWRFVAPEFERDHRVILFDHVGAGQSDLSAYSTDKYQTLDGYARDVVEIGDALGVSDGVFVGHSVAAMIGVLAHRMRDELFGHLVLVGPSPCYLNDGDYQGGFTHADIEGLLDAMASNYLGWSSDMAPAIVGRPDRPELGDELTGSFCRTDPAIAEEFARATFLSDNRDDLPFVESECLILQCAEDFIAPRQVGEYVHRRIPRSELVVLDTTGHCPHLSVPEHVVASMRDFLP